VDGKTFNPYFWAQDQYRMNNELPGAIATKAGYNRLLLLVAGLGGLLYGVDVGIISGALPYLQATFKDAATGQTLRPDQLSMIVAAVLLGSMISTLFAGLLADWFGRKAMMIVSGFLFVVSIPIISLAHNYDVLMAGRLLQGISGGFIGVVIPLYLAECLGASSRGKGTGIFQWLLTLGIFAAAIISFVFSAKVDAIARLGNAEELFRFKDVAWRSIFWISLPPGILFTLGGFFVAESPRWLFRHGRVDAARAALLRSRSEAQAETELKEMAETAAAEKSVGEKVKESLLRRKYVIPFLLACVILTCNQATGINSVIGYNATILIQAGLSDEHAHLGYVVFTCFNFLATIAAVLLVDRKGRKFLLSLGTAGIIISMIWVGLLFHRTEKLQMDVKDTLQAQVATNQTFSVTFNSEAATNLLGTNNFGSQPTTLVVIYSYGGFRGATTAVRSDDMANQSVRIERDSVVPVKKFEAMVEHPLTDYDVAKNAPLKIDHALITPVPGEKNGWLTAIALFVFVSFFAIGPGVCVWLALSELMPTRIRSNGMSIALLINQTVSTTIAAIFLPTVGAHGYATMFFTFAGCTVVYFITAFFFLPETKGKTLEEIEEHFEGGKK
jgi:MFS transporter, SP family, solute carrier family 2 (myo-inositol transporter), member 13